MGDPAAPSLRAERRAICGVGQFREARVIEQRPSLSNLVLPARVAELVPQLDEVVNESSISHSPREEGAVGSAELAAGADPTALRIAFRRSYLPDPSAVKRQEV